MSLFKALLRRCRHLEPTCLTRSLLTDRFLPSASTHIGLSCNFIKQQHGNHDDDRSSVRFSRIRLAVPFLASALLFGGAHLHDDDDVPPRIVYCAEASPKKFSAERLSAIKALDVVAEVVAEVEPAVVSITTGTFLNMPTSGGSGFIIDDTGLIITNAHVVGHKQVLRVNIKDGRSFDAKVLAIDVTSDLALVQLQTDEKSASNLPHIRLAPSSQLIRSGQFVIALGSPLMLTNTVTVGVVSAVERDLGHRTGLKYIQTDAIITVGNSGGPLVNLYGEVIGVNTMIVDTGLGFAVPIDQVQRFIETAKVALSRRPPTSAPSPTTSPTQKRRSWLRGGSSSADQQSVVVSSGQQHTRYLGLVMRTLTPELIFEISARDSFSRIDLVNVKSGVLICGVMRGSPADRSGLRPGDIIVSIDGQPIESTGEVYSAIENKETLSISLLRQGKILEFPAIHTEPV